MPNEPEIEEYFGVYKGRSDQSLCALGMGSVLYDVLNHMMLDVSLHPTGYSERECAVQHLTQTQEDDLLLYDRGYPAFWLFALHIQQQRKFCMRTKTTQWRLSRDFLASGEKDKVMTVNIPSSARQKCQKRGLSLAPIQLRLVRVDLPNEVEVLITNLTDQKRYPSRVFQSLYFCRWGIEENYKRIKQWAEIENFSGKSVLSIQQDFYAKILATNLTAIMALSAQKKVKKRTRHRQHSYQVNFAQSLSKMKHRIICILISPKHEMISQIQKAIDYISHTIEAVRKDRSSPRRVKNTKNDIHFACYKSAL